MKFELLDRYLLEGVPSKGEVVSALLADQAKTPAARPFYEGLRRLGAHTPDLALIALRLVLAGKRADDQSVTRVRGLVQRVHAGGADGEKARAAYASEVGP
jgi:hypothetical protein